MTERRVGTLLSLFFFMTFAMWLPDAPLLPDLHPPRRGTLDTVPLWPLDQWMGVPLTALLWNRAVLYLLGTAALGAMFCFLMGGALRLAEVTLAVVLAAKLAFLSWDLRYLTGADTVHLTLTAVFLLGRPRLMCLRVALLILSLIGVINRMGPAWLDLELLNAMVGPVPPLKYVTGAWLLAEAIAPLLWLSHRAVVRQTGVVLWLALQALSWAILSVLWPTSLAACGPLLVLGAVLLVPLEGPLQQDYEPGPGATVPAVILGVLLVATLWPSPVRGWLHVYELDALLDVKSRVLITKADSQISIHTAMPLERNWNPEVSTRVKTAAVVDGEPAHNAGRLTDPLRLDGTMAFSPYRFRHASPALQADPRFYHSYAAELIRSFHPDRLQIQLDVNGRRTLDYDWKNPNPTVPRSLDQGPGEGDTL